MRKLFFALFAFIALTVTAQAQTKSHYVSASLSLANSNGQQFSQSSYASVEYGIVRKGVAYGLSVGRGQLNGDVTTNTNAQDLKNYFWEVRVQPTFPLGSVTGNVILGAGSYIGTSDAGFIEYGLGVSKSYGNVSYGLSYSNWNGVDYVTPSVSYAF